MISKIIANQLKKLLPEFISLNKSAFVKDRLLIENLLLATELVKDYHKDSVSRRCAIKVDISKAFDSVQWSSIQHLDSAEIPREIPTLDISFCHYGFFLGPSEWRAGWVLQE